jgi:hypothetical protein
MLLKRYDYSNLEKSTLVCHERAKLNPKEQNKDYSHGGAIKT